MQLNLKIFFHPAGKDAEKYMNFYTEPLLKGLLSATSASWVTSAKPIKPFHVEFSISAAGAFVPEDQESFEFIDSDYEYLKLDSGSNILPTVMGGSSQSVLKVVIPDLNNNEVKLLDFNAPDGIKDDLPMNVVPGPNIQLAMGLPLGSEVAIRYTPKLTTDDGAFFQIIGFGFKHSISQYFGKKGPLNIAAHVAYQNISTGVDDIDTDQAVHFDLNTISIQGLASLDFKLLSIYSKLGFTQAYTNLDVLGTYSYTYDIQDTDGNHLRYETISITDPLKLEQDINGLKFGFGAKLKLLVFQIFADYTIQEYSVANVGIGFKF